MLWIGAETHVAAQARGAEQGAGMTHHGVDRRSNGQRLAAAIRTEPHRGTALDDGVHDPHHMTHPHRALARMCRAPEGKRPPQQLEIDREKPFEQDAVTENGSVVQRHEEMTKRATPGSTPAWWGVQRFL